MTAPSSIRAKLDFSQFLASPGDISGGDTTTFNLLSTKAQQGQRQARANVWYQLHVRVKVDFDRNVESVLGCADVAFSGNFANFTTSR